MKEKPKKGKGPRGKYRGTIFAGLLGIVIGLLLVPYLTSETVEQMPFWIEWLMLPVMLLVLCVAFFVQVIVHEAGHLVFGRLSGYTFVSFRIMSFMWIKENNELKFKRLSLAGTGGQCLMAPPEMKDGKIPVLLYNMGGVIMNTGVGLVFLGLYALTRGMPTVSVVMMLFALAGFVSALMNGIPMASGGVNNDGYNALSIRKSSEAMRGFWVQLKVNEQTAKGVRLKDMPAEWFTTPTDEGMKNSITAVMGVLACGRLMDQHRFQEADQLMGHLLDIDSGIVGIHRNLMLCDRVLCELIGENRPEAVEALWAAVEKKFIQSMSRFPTVLRTQYAYALLAEKNETAANEVQARFDKYAESYPYPSDIQAERELMEIVRHQACVPSDA